MTSPIKAKPTLYMGTRFRSRLEARWAAFFEAVGREWIYEPQLPELSTFNYQPDFLVDGWTTGETTLIEVKPMPEAEGLAKLVMDDRWQRVADATKCTFALLQGVPGIWIEGRLTAGGHFALVCRPDRRESRDFAEWAECPKCDRIGLWSDGFATCCPPSLPVGPLYRAYGAVRDASFEDPA